MALSTVAVVSFSLAKVALRLMQHDTLADAADDLTSGALRLWKYRERRIARSLAQEMANGMANVGAAHLADHDRRAALAAVDQLLTEVGDDLAVEAVMSADGLWSWVLEHGGGQYQASLGGDSGEYFERLLRHCVAELKRRSPGAGFQTAADKRLLTDIASLKQQLDALQTDAQRLLDAEPQRRDALERVLASSTAYARELSLPEGQYVVRTVEGSLLELLADKGSSWPRVVVGEAGSGKSTLLWSLQCGLERAGFDPLLVSAAWLMAHPHHMEDVVSASKLLRSLGSPVMLLDTVDLMLHQEGQRQSMLALVEQLWAAGVPAIYTTRPQERPLLQHPNLRETELGAYDDAEVRIATRALAGMHCPASDADVVLRGVLDSVARGLPATEVCRSPLLLKMLFESASPSAPEFTDLDVTSLYGDYWTRRVVRDARSEAATVMRVNHRDDLSSAASATAAALLVLGLPQERVGSVRAVADCIEPRVGPALEEGIARLVERGVLDVSLNTLSFFHQTMLEYAFARWWLASRDPEVLARLVERTTAGHGDLFVGAALEQTLILAARDGGGSAHLRAACEKLVDGTGGAVEAIGLAVWAHHEGMLPSAPTLLPRCDDSALSRTARLLPSVGGKPTAEVVRQLELLWNAKESTAVRVAVLHALARVALHDPDAAVDTLGRLDLLAGAVAFEADVQDASGLIGATKALADDEPEAVVEALIEVLRPLPSRHADFVGCLCEALLRRGGPTRRLILGYLRAHWQTMGSSALVHDVLDTVGFPDALDTGLVEPCGKLVLKSGSGPLMRQRDRSLLAFASRRTARTPAALRSSRSVRSPACSMTIVSGCWSTGCWTWGSATSPRGERACRHCCPTMRPRWRTWRS